MRAHQENGFACAYFLQASTKVSAVLFPGSDYVTIHLFFAQNLISKFALIACPNIPHNTP